MTVCQDIKEAYNNKMRGKLFGLLCEFEKEGEWEKFLDSILVELLGYEEDEKTINYYTLYHKLSALRFMKYEYFRRTIFECINLVGK